MTSHKALKDMLVRHEGLRLKPYRDTVGKLTIGVGRNLDDNGISAEEAMLMLDADIVDHSREAQKLPVFVKLDMVRQDVLIDMTFNLGLPRLQGFKKFLAALEARDWPQAAKEMLDSKWATQVGSRATELARMIETGAYQNGG